MKLAAKGSLLVLTIILLHGCSSFQSVSRTKSLKEQALSDLYPLLNESDYRKLQRTYDDNDVQEFVNNFWKESDPTPGTGENELKDEYQKRLNYANEHFPDLKGWGRSDMKRIYLQYGPPDDIERADWNGGDLENSRRIKSYQIWVYYEPGKNSFMPTKTDGIVPGPRRFLFVDLNGVKVFTLVYSSEDIQDINAIINGVTAQPMITKNPDFR